MNSDTNVQITNFIPESGYITMTIVLDRNVACHLNHIIPREAEDRPGKFAVVVKDILDARLISDCYNNPVWQTGG